MPPRSSESARPLVGHGTAADVEVEPGGVDLDLDGRKSLRNFAIALHRAMAEGYDIRGLSLRSPPDDFERAVGYANRPEIVRVDSAMRRRTRKLVAHRDTRVIRVDTDL